MRATLAELVTADRAWAPPAFPDPQTFHLRLLQRVREAHPQVNPWYYDLPPDAVRAAFPDVPPAEGPPGEALVEMPPFVLVTPWRHPSPAELADLPLVLATPRNSFRLDFLRSLFPAARLRVVHLTRNPAASINGLVDGWHHAVSSTARSGAAWPSATTPIGTRAGAARGGATTSGRGHEWAHAPLADVCAEQWRAPHEATLDFLAAADGEVPSYRLRWEDVTGDDDGRARAFADLARWLGHPQGVSGLGRVRLPPLMATAAPRPGRWQARAGALDPALSRPGVIEMAEHLGYRDPSTWR